MRVLVLSGSVRNNSNTVLLLQPLLMELGMIGLETDIITIKDLHIETCMGCGICQDNFEAPGCSKNDDMNLVFKSVLESDCIIFATPVYSWYCTPPMKAVLDRLVYGMNKYYGKRKGPSLWSGKKCALVTTCGYEIEEGADILEAGFKKYAHHSKLDYLGMLAVRDTANKSHFESDCVVFTAQNFAHKIRDSLRYG